VSNKLNFFDKFVINIQLGTKMPKLFIFAIAFFWEECSKNSDT